MSAKQKILIEAAKLIHTKGFNNTSIQDILDIASVTKSNFYYHFDSKEQLGFEVLTGRMQWFYGRVIEPSLDNPALNPLQRIYAFLDGILALGTSPLGELGCPFGNLAQEMSAIHEPLRQALSAFFRAGADRLEHCFEEGKQAGIFREQLPSSQIAEFVLAQTQGMFLLRKTHKDPQIMERNIDMLHQLIEGWLTHEGKQATNRQEEIRETLPEPKTEGFE
ncbi:MAG: TetR/AcrR family transcriptional regulator [Candidatus Abyssobacteria bacterium SURF_17]|uniref:TetR/AcrR family transcriptional regulator n=1 Tax=Candidatus Abyssobacteria bacterium SURF_17 TaxID=2093361 RepID=A0A419F633_9BACT|nr:MAG: TetR/AcrR family transcriptional regulator [Candidatus Abyssubacteria bacterium SURF_17]